MFSGLFSALWWALGSGAIFAPLGFILVLYLGKTWTKIAIGGVIFAIAFSALIGLYRAGQRHGGAKTAQTYDKVIGRKAQKVRGAEKNMKQQKLIAKGNLEAQLNQIKAKSKQEREWMRGNSVPDRLTNEALDVLGK